MTQSDLQSVKTPFLGKDDVGRHSAELADLATCCELVDLLFLQQKRLACKETGTNSVQSQPDSNNNKYRVVS